MARSRDRGRLLGVVTFVAAFFLVAHVLARDAIEREPLVIGSKSFTEGRLLAEIMAQLIEATTDVAVERRFNLGGTLLVFSALRNGEIDLYPEYTGTGWAVVLKVKERARDPLETYLHVKREYGKRYGLVWLAPFGFENSYAIVMREDQARQLGVSRISDLVAHGERLRAGVSHELLNREDGFHALAERYGLEVGELRGLEHGLAYEAIRSGQIDITDAYTTDGKLRRFNLRVLEDDRGFFPPYDCAPVVRGDAMKRYPEIEQALDSLAFKIPAERMQALNFAVEVERRSFAEVARAFLEEEKLISPDGITTPGEALPQRGQSFMDFMIARIPVTLSLTVDHLVLTGLSVLCAILTAVPLGIALTRREIFARTALNVAGIIQTIPGIALLAFMIPLFGLGARPAIAALFLYAVLPILLNTYTGIKEVDPKIVEAGRGMGLRDRQVLWYVELPLAVPVIMAGVRTGTVFTIGIATLAAFIGAGGLGDPIVTGLQLNDTFMVLSGAIPAALLAVAADLVLGRIQRALLRRR